MDTRLLRHYENELSFLREMGAEFAESFPKIAARLGIEGVEVLDPYVERLLEGVAFLTARVQLELELQYPAFTSHLLDTVYPHYLGPTPSMMIARLNPDMANAALGKGFVLPRQTKIRSKLVEGTQSACDFRTAHDVTLWPLEITEAEYVESRGDLVAAGVAGPAETRAGIRLRLHRHAGKKLDELNLERLTLFLGGQAVSGSQLYELIAMDSVGIAARSTNRRADWTIQLPGGVEPRGFSPDDALLPVPRRAFDGYRLLQEYFALPQRFHFVDLAGLAPAMARCEDDAVDLYIQLRRGNPGLAAGIAPDAFQLNCVPAINLFEKRCDRTHMTTQDSEQHIVADRTAPLDFEVHSVLSVTGISGDGEPDIPFRPFYSADDATGAGGTAPAYYNISRKVRQRTERERLRGQRTNYVGSEVYVSLVDGSQVPYGPTLSQLSVRAMVTNRDLPMMLSMGARDLFYLPDGGPVKAITLPVTPTRPRPSIAEGEAAWRLISHLGLNYLSVADAEDGSGSKALRELIGIYAERGEPVMVRRLEGILGVRSRPIVRRLSDEVISTAVRGLEIELEFDEDYFEGSSVYLLGAVLDRFFQGYATINSFTETVLRTQQRGTIARWKPRRGLGRII